MKHFKEDNAEDNKNIKLWIWLTVAIVLILLIITISILIYKYVNTEDYVNNKMAQLVTDYFERDIKENAVGVNRLLVTLPTLQDAGFNIKSIKGKKGVVEEAFSYVIIENPEEKDVTKMIYIIENHLYGD